MFALSTLQKSTFKRASLWSRVCFNGVKNYFNEPKIKNSTSVFYFNSNW